jgi:hypothetical protein
MEGTYSGNPTASTQAFISDMPSKYRPSHTQYCCGLAYTSDDSRVFPARLSVFSNGNIDMSETAFPNGAQMRIGIMYLF